MRDQSDITMSDEEVTKLADIQSAMLALPKDARHGPVREVTKAIADLIGSDAAFTCYFFDGTINFIEHRIGPQISDHIMETFKGVDANGDFLMSDPAMEESNKAARQIGTAAINYEQVAEVMGFDFKDTQTYREVWQPAGMENIVAIQCRLPIGYVIMCFSFRDDRIESYRDPFVMQKLQLLLPSFTKAFTELYDMGAEYVRYESAVFDMPIPAVIVDNDDRPVCANKFASSLLQDQPEEANDRIKRAFRLPGPLLPNGSASEILLMLNAQPTKSAVLELADNMKLTPRQAETAFYLTRGYTDRQIAAAMEISLSTARNHTEAVLDTLNISSRSGVLFILLSGRTIADHAKRLGRSDQSLADKLLNTTRDKWPAKISHRQ